MHFAISGRRRGPAGRRGAIVSLARFQSERDALLARNAPLGVRLKSDQSPERLGDDVHRLSRGGAGISEIPRRTRLFLGPAAAHAAGFHRRNPGGGRFSLDQLAYQRRVGFDAWEVADGFADSRNLHRALAEISNVYQPSADGRKTIRDLRCDR